ncbi:MAG TPA: LAGLIDADG family homing endonuclease [Stellaceae bacterium]|jgi:hypothetical protein|nr:LAGLIDADG family homing endonuclease [Stellaceae bacterium]
MKRAVTDLAYLAGFIDGEGSISIFPGTSRGRRRDNLRLDIYNTNEAVLQWIKRTFGGRIHKVGRPKARNTKQEYVWAAGAQCAAQILKACLPFLKIKRTQAELFIQHQATSRRNGRYYTPPEILAVRNDIVAKMASLNRRGPSNKEARE